MLFLAGAAAGGAADLISSLKQGFGSKPGGADVWTPFDVWPTGNTGSAGPTAPTAPPSPLTPSAMTALLQAQGQSSSQGLMSLLDTDGNGTVSKTEFAQALGQNGNQAKADDLFAKLDTNKDGSIDANEMSAALKSRHGHHHHHGAPAAASAEGGGNASEPPKGTTSQRSINPDGSTTTTISYADGSKVSMTTPVGASAASGASANNMLERLIQKQAQMLMQASSAGPSVSVSA